MHKPLVTTTGELKQPKLFCSEQGCSLLVFVYICGVPITLTHIIVCLAPITVVMVTLTA